MPQDPDTQRELFFQAVEALGGQSAAAAVLGINVRTVRRLVSGEMEIHDGTLERTATALVAHADTCRALERQLSPAFAENRTARQISGSANKGRHPEPRRKSVSEGAREAYDHMLANERRGRRWEVNGAAMDGLAGDLKCDGKLTRLFGIPVALVDDGKTDPTFKLIVEPRHG